MLSTLSVTDFIAFYFSPPHAMATGMWPLDHHHPNSCQSPLEAALAVFEHERKHVALLALLPHALAAG